MDFLGFNALATCLNTSKVVSLVFLTDEGGVPKKYFHVPDYPTLCTFSISVVVILWPPPLEVPLLCLPFLAHLVLPLPFLSVPLLSLLPLTLLLVSLPPLALMLRPLLNCE